MSIAGFALMLKKLNTIDAHLKSLERKIDRITADRRSDDLRLTLADVGTVNGGVKLGHGAAQNWATLGLRGTRVMSGGQSAALSM